MQIDHINIKAPQALLEEVREFYCAVLGLKEGFRPDFSTAGFWLYADDQPIVHLSFGEEKPAPKASGYLDHVAFQANGLEDFVSRLDDRGIAYRSSFIPELSVTQLFFRDPAGTGLEVNFPREIMS
jgi:catechol 2,3-dioxygenase-like lactoylglutathione lyase family enzyme